MTIICEAAPQNTDAFGELTRYLDRDRLTWEECPNPIVYWGVSGDSLSCKIYTSKVISVFALQTTESMDSYLVK